MTPTVDEKEALLAHALGVAEAFPWQNVLLDRFVHGDLPDSLDIPTGLGKTAVMAVWLVARALGAPVPRRLLYVVDRRAVVDQATDVAQRLRTFVNDAPGLRERLGLVRRELPISTLRGQFADNREWLADPCAPAIIVGTVDMVGSRLLFEGYGVSRKTRSFHAGMLGADALLVLDEAHLVPAFETLTRTIARGGHEYGPRDGSLAALIPSFRVLSLSATGKSDGSSFRLTAKDQDHSVVRRRLDAEKRLILRAALDPDEASLAEALAEEAWSVSGEGTRTARVIVFCNSRRDARGVYDALESKLSKARKAKAPSGENWVGLLVGERRVYERESVAGWLARHGFIAGSDARNGHTCFLVATSAGEVGIDLDADHMVSDLVAWERMVQRLGRVNRRGTGAAQVIVLPCLPNKKERAALEADAGERSAEDRSLVQRRQTVEAARDVLQHLPRSEQGSHDASPSALVALKRRAEEDAQLREQLTRATTPAPLHPALSRAVLESWSMTSLDEHAGRPDVQPWLRGWIEGEEPQTQVVWRAHLPVNAQGKELAKRDTEAFFDAAGPHLLETLQADTSDVLSWLKKRLEALMKHQVKGATPLLEEREAAPQGEATQPADSEEVGPDERVASEQPGGASAVKSRKLDRSDVIAFVLTREGEPRHVTAEVVLGKEYVQRKELGDIERAMRGGAIVVLDQIHGLTQGLLDERSDQGEDIARIDAARLPFLVEAGMAGETRVAPQGSDQSSAEKRWRKELELVTKADAEETPQRLLTVWTDVTHPASTEEARSVGREQRLDEHESWAEAQAKRIAEALRLPAAYQRMLEVAARLHDEGKAVDRWQRAFKAKPGGPWGKTESRPNQRLLDGYRHEFGSLLLVEQHERLRDLDVDLRDLCLHLIAAHHGFARPSIRTNGCDKLPPSALQEKAQEVALRFVRLEKRWGPWGLAWWETLLRAADQEASRLNDERGKDVRRG